MHVAICFWGLLRALQFTVHNIEENVLRPLQAYGHTYDIFLHTYSLNGEYRSDRNNEVGVKVNASNWALLHPQYVYVEDQDEFDKNINYEAYQKQGDPWHNGFSSFKNHMRALNSLHHVARALEAVAVPRDAHTRALRHYDAVLFLRPDVQFLDALPVALLHTLRQEERDDTHNAGSQTHKKQTGHIATQLPQTVFLSDFHRSCDGGEYNDRFALSTVLGAVAYGKKLLTAYDYALHYKLHAEKFTFYHLHASDEKFAKLREQGMRSLSSLTQNHTSQHPLIPVNPYTIRSKIVEIPFRFRRVRSNGEVHKRDYEVTSSQEHAYHVRHNEVYTGKTPPTVWYMRWLYTALEIVTLGQVYVWNHDDNGNLYCSPHNRLSHTQVTHTEYAVPPLYTHTQVASQPLFNAHNGVEVLCGVVWEERETFVGLSRYRVPTRCVVKERRRMRRGRDPSEKKRLRRRAQYE